MVPFSRHLMALREAIIREEKWRSAALAGFNALKYLKEIRQDKLMIPEISFSRVYSITTLSGYLIDIQY